MGGGASGRDSAPVRSARVGPVRARPRVTLLTDFGTADGYVAAMRGVIAAIAPDIIVDDASHAIEPGDIAAAAWTLGRYWDRYPPGTVHTVVVDPGVGGARRPLAGEAAGRLFVAPDNGVLTRVLNADAEARLFHIDTDRVATDSISATFHGRDIFAPAAALIATGMAPAELGPAIDDPIRLESEQPSYDSDGSVRGVVAHVDRFGNLITNVPEAWLAGATGVEVAGHGVGPLRRRYVDVQPGEPVALVGSAGVLEIAVRDGSAAGRLGVGRGASVALRFQAGGERAG